MFVMVLFSIQIWNKNSFGAAMTAISAVLAELVVVALDPRVRVS